MAKSKKLSLGIRIGLTTLVTLALAFLGGKVAEYLEAPFYFGFVFALVLVGMIGMFILAAQLSEAGGK